MKKILFSMSAIVAVAALALYSTGAFFSDTETSTGNVFTAGAIDLQIDSTQHYNGNVCVKNNLDVQSIVAPPAYVWSGNAPYPVPGTACTGSWDLQNLGNGQIASPKFFNFGDIKPGDSGENTISMHVINNDAWLCAKVSNLTNDDNGLTGPEALVDSTGGAGQGELQQNMVWKVWRDDGAGGGVAGDNVQNGTEQTLASGHPVNGTLAVYDANTGTGPLPGATTGYLGVSWSLPSSVGNEVQTDSMTADIGFEVIQSRNNMSFTCGQAQNNESTTVVRAENLAANSTEVGAHPEKWFFYNDTNDTIDSTLGSFLVGPGTPTYGTGSAQMTLSASPLDRKNIATTQFGGTLLSDISAMSFTSYSPSGAWSSNESPYLNFNVDFNNSNTWQRRLVYVPSQNGTVTQNSWQTWDVINSGNAMWTWSGFAANGNKWPDNDTNEYRTWNAIKAAFPSAKMLSTGAWLGVRVGEPGPTGYTGSVDYFSTTINSVTKNFNFEN